jgi:hypothetical protein
MQSLTPNLRMQGRRCYIAAHPSPHDPASIGSDLSGSGRFRTRLRVRAQALLQACLLWFGVFVLGIVDIDICKIYDLERTVPGVGKIPVPIVLLEEQQTQENDFRRK